MALLLEFLRLLSPTVSLLEGTEGLSNITVPNVYPSTVDPPPDVEESVHSMISYNENVDDDYQPPPESSIRKEAKSMDIIPEKRNSRKNSCASLDKKWKKEIKPKPKPEPEPVVKKRPNILGQSYQNDINWWALATMVYKMIKGIPPFWDKWILW